MKVPNELRRLRVAALCASTVLVAAFATAHASDRSPVLGNVVPVASTLRTGPFIEGVSRENVQRPLSEGIVLEVGPSSMPLDDILSNEDGDLGIRMPRTARDCKSDAGILRCR